MYLCKTKIRNMFDKLIEFIVSLGHDILPFTIVNQWEMGVHLRFGKFVKVVQPGIKFKIPFFDKIWAHEVITQTVHLQPQTLTTQDELNIVLKSIVRYHVYDVRKFLLNVMHASDVLVDTTQGIIRDIVERTDWNDLVDVNDAITEEVAIIAENWGITIEKITLTDLGIVRTYRIMSDGQKQTTSSLGLDGL
jgi:regulator of protease activity HflC (stomatin/prohibitin superfamily)